MKREFLLTKKMVDQVVQEIPIKVARGEYCLNIDSDDWIDK